MSALYYQNSVPLQVSSYYNNYYVIIAYFSLGIYSLKILCMTKVIHSFSK